MSHASGDKQKTPVMEVQVLCGNRRTQTLPETGFLKRGGSLDVDKAMKKSLRENNGDRVDETGIQRGLKPVSDLQIPKSEFRDSVQAIKKRNIAEELRLELRLHGCCSKG